MLKHEKAVGGEGCFSHRETLCGDAGCTRHQYKAVFGSVLNLTFNLTLRLLPHPSQLYQQPQSQPQPQPQQPGIGFGTNDRKGIPSDKVHMHLGRLRKARRPLTSQAREKLEEIFQRGQIPSGKGSQQRKRQLALELGIPYSKIEKWFDNRNMKRRKEEQRLFEMFLEKRTDEESASGDGEGSGASSGSADAAVGSKRKRKVVRRIVLVTLATHSFPFQSKPHSEPQGPSKIPFDPPPEHVRLAFLGVDKVLSSDKAKEMKDLRKNVLTIIKAGYGETLQRFVNMRGVARVAAKRFVLQRRAGKVWQVIGEFDRQVNSILFCCAYATHHQVVGFLFVLYTVVI